MAEPPMIRSVSALALLGLASGCGLTLASLVSSTWMTTESGAHVGLFSSCFENHCDRINFTQDDTGRDKHFRYKVVRGLLVSGLITGVSGFITALGFVVDAVRGKGVNSLALLRASIVLNPIAGCITILGAVVFVTTIYQSALHFPVTKLNYSFGMAVAGGGTKILSALLVYLGGPRRVASDFDTLCLRNTGPHLLAAVPQPPEYSSPLQHHFDLPPPYELQKLAIPPAYDEAPLLPPAYETIFEQRSLKPP